MKVTQTHQVTKSQNVLLGEISSFLCLVADRDPNAQIIVGGRSVAISTQGQFVYVPTLERHPKAFLAASMDSNNLYDANADLITGGVIMQEVAIDPTLLQDIHTGLRLWLSQFHGVTINEIYVVFTTPLAGEDPDYLNAVFELSEMIIKRGIKLEKSKVANSMLFLWLGDEYVIISPKENRIYRGNSTPETWRMQIEFDQEQWKLVLDALKSWLAE